VRFKRDNLKDRTFVWVQPVGESSQRASA